MITQLISPYLFSRYIKELLGAVANSGIGCNVANQFVNILAYADDLVLIVPSWRGLQSLMCKHAVVINMSVNKNKTVCMMFKLKNRNRIVASEFPRLITQLILLKHSNILDI